MNAPAKIKPSRDRYIPIVTHHMPLCEGRELELRCSLLMMRAHLDVVQSFETDIALVTAYATQFPSNKSRQVLDEVANEVRQ